MTFPHITHALSDLSQAASRLKGLPTARVFGCKSRLPWR